MTHQFELGQVLTSSVRTQMMTRGYFQAYSCWKLLEISGTVYIFHLTDTPKNQNLKKGPDVDYVKKSNKKFRQEN